MSLVGKPVVNRRILNYGSTGDEFIADASFACDGCGRMSVVTWTTSYDPSDKSWDDFGREGGGPQHYETARWSPEPSHQMEYPDVPDAIAGAATEAWTCHAVGATTAAR